MTKIMKIVHCILSFNTGGAETMLIDIANDQVKTSDVSIIIINNSYSNELISKLSPSIKVIRINRPLKSRSIIPIIKLNWTLFRLHPDIIHIHNAVLNKIILESVSRGLFLTVHALRIPLECVRRNTHIIAISDAVKQDIENRITNEITVIPNGINTSAIKKKEIYKIDKCFKIVQVARLDSSKKGQDILIKAIAQLKRQNINNVYADFIGAGESEQELKKLAKDLNVDKQINFLGLKDREYIYSHLCNYDMMCHPSRYEGFGLTVAEGMAAGLPTLVPDSGGPYEVTGFGKFGFSFKNEDFNDCANKILQIINGYAEIKPICLNAMQHIDDKYSVSTTAKKYNLFYNTVL